MSGKKNSLLVENDLSSGFEESLEEFGMLPRNNSRHHNVNRMTNNLCLAISKDFCKTLTSFENFSYRLLVATHMNHCGIVAKQDIRGFSVLIQ